MQSYCIWRCEIQKEALEPGRAKSSASLMFVVVEGFPEADPYIEQSQAAAHAAKKTGGDHGAKPGIREQQIIVGPFRSPGQDHEQDTGNSADEHEQEN